MYSQQEADREEILDQNHFGNLSSHFSNRFHLFVGPSISRLYFGDQILKDSKVVFHTHVTMHTSDLVELRKLIDRLLENRDMSQG